MKSFEIPSYYRSSVISDIKKIRKNADRTKKDFSPTILDFGPVRFLIARHFGFCYGVENAIEIIYRMIEENPNKRVFLLSEMIHNPTVNKDLVDLGVQFMMDTKGNQLIEWETLLPDDIVVIPAFGTTIEIENILKKRQSDIKKFNTTCPFVEKVWKRSASLGKENYTVVIHGKPEHEETRATFSHSREHAASIVIKNLEEAKKLGEIILGQQSLGTFHTLFGDRTNPSFNPEKDLQSIGVVNQTTMLASDTQEIADYLKSVMGEKFAETNIKNHFADTRDTLCYATNDNQGSVYNLLEEEADLAIVIGGYNSSNTSHLVELCEEKLNTFFISSAAKIIDKKNISHFNFHTKEELNSSFIPDKDPLTIMLTSGASCPDKSVDEVIEKILSFFPDSKSIEEVMKEFNLSFPTS